MQWLKVACKKVIYFWKRPINILLHAPCKRQLHFFFRPFIISKIVFVFAYNILLLFRNAKHVYFNNILKNIYQISALASTNITNFVHSLMSIFLYSVFLIFLMSQKYLFYSILWYFCLLKLNMVRIIKQFLLHNVVLTYCASNNLGSYCVLPEVYSYIPHLH